MSRLKITNEELQEAMREHGVERYRDVRLAMLEIDGNISIISNVDGMKQSVYKRKHPHKRLDVS
ncbi:YetF domain-containing protein [Sphingobacterium bambusae]|uniref:YetF domain-containing protein n=1 Tax=Sphingobacterium bambusae TaxID=662858 RepID=A0ABW6BMI2_9SPHI|nr:YetF domain-containing protein [Sphingobacterium bambusae]WPL47787.1 DUF421 domain-containing protein [Sphingobacterium bambusae]